MVRMRVLENVANLVDPRWEMPPQIFYTLGVAKSERTIIRYWPDQWNLY